MIAIGTFGERTRILEDMVGDGDLVGRFVVNQVYAAVQHEGGWLSWMGTGQPKRIKRHLNGRPVPSKFVEGPLKKNVEAYYQNLAENVLLGTVREAMAENVEDQNDELKVYSPELTGALKRSGNRIVTDDGSIFSYRPQEVPYKVGGEPFEEAKRRGIEY